MGELRGPTIPARPRSHPAGTAPQAGTRRGSVPHRPIIFLMGPAHGASRSVWAYPGEARYPANASAGPMLTHGMRATPR